MKKFVKKKSIDGVLGIWTRRPSMEGADKSTELLRPTLFDLTKDQCATKVN